MSERIGEWLDLIPIQARADLATAGPWYIGNAVDPTTRWNVHQHPSCAGVADAVMPLDAEFIAAARDDVPALLAEVIKLRGIIRELMS